MTFPELTHRWRLTIAYLLLTVAVLVAMTLSIHNQGRIEDQALEHSQQVAAEAKRASAENCRTANDLKGILRDVLLVIVGEPRSEGYDDRLALFEQIEPLLVLSECPPVPPYGGSNP